MRVHVVNVMRGDPEIAGRTLDRFAEFARGVEERGFHGLWMTDSFGRGRPDDGPDRADERRRRGHQAGRDRHLRPAGAGAPPGRTGAPHRKSLHALLGDRLMLGLGCGSTKADFDLVGEDYDARFKTLMTLARDHARGLARRAAHRRRR